MWTKTVFCQKMCFKNTFLWIRFMKTLIRCALQYVADKYVHNKKSERVNLWDFLIIGGKLWEKSTFNVPQKNPTFVGLFRYSAWVWATPPHDAHAWVHLSGYFVWIIVDFDSANIPILENFRFEPKSHKPLVNLNNDYPA